MGLSKGMGKAISLYNKKEKPSLFQVSIFIHSLPLDQAEHAMLAESKELFSHSYPTSHVKWQSIFQSIDLLWIYIGSYKEFLLAFLEIKITDECMS